MAPLSLGLTPNTLKIRNFLCEEKFQGTLSRFKNMLTKKSINYKKNSGDLLNVEDYVSNYIG